MEQFLNQQKGVGDARSYSPKYFHQKIYQISWRQNDDRKLLLIDTLLCPQRVVVDGF